MRARDQHPATNHHSCGLWQKQKIDAGHGSLWFVSNGIIDFQEFIAKAPWVGPLGQNDNGSRTNTYVHICIYIYIYTHTCIARTEVPKLQASYWDYFRCLFPRGLLSILHFSA